MIRVEMNPNDISHKKIADDLWEITEKMTCQVTFKNEVFKYQINEGFTTNYRSGPSWLNKIIDKIGDSKLAISWIVHDINYEGYLSRGRADKLLYYMLLYARIEDRICELVYAGLRVFGSFNYSDDRDNPHVVFEHRVGRGIAENFIKLENDRVDGELHFPDTNYEFVKSQLMELAKKEGVALKETAVELFYHRDHL